MKALLACLTIAAAFLASAEQASISVTATDSLHKRVSVDLKDAEATDVVKAVAKAFKYNLIVDESVKGRTITIQLKDVELEDALDQISEFLGLSYDISGNTIMMDTLRNVREQGKFKKSERISLKYTDATEAKEMLKNVIPEDSAVQVNKASNEIIINDIASQVRKAKRMLDNLDRQPVQIMLEAKIVEVATSSLKEYGFNWSTQGVLQASTDGAIGVYSGGSSSIQGVLKLLETKGKANIIANPRISTLNNKTATLDVSDRVPVSTRTVDSTGRETITATYETVGVNLKITPQINDNGYITVNIKPRVSSITEFTGPNNDWPKISSREAETLVRVKDGETIIIGGLNKNEERVSQVKFPILGDIPLLGLLFTSTKHDLTNTEVIILVMPKIIK